MANEKRVRANGVQGTINLGIIAADVNLSGTFLTRLPVVDATNHAALTLDPESDNPEIVYVTAHAAAADTATILRGQEGTVARDHALDTRVVHAPTARDFRHRSVRVSRTAGDILVNWVAYAEVAAGLDLVLPASPGDVIEIGIDVEWGGEAGSARMDAGSWVAGAAVNYWSGLTGADIGVQAWRGFPASLGIGKGGVVRRSLVAADISGGNVTIKILTKVNAGSRTIRASAGQPFVAWATNLGAEDS